MSGSSIRLDGDTSRLLRKLKSFSDIDKKKINNVLGEAMVTSTNERFKLGKDPQGRKWKTSIRAEEEGGKTLIKSAVLKNSIHSQADASSFAVGTNVKYGATHKFGDKRTIRARNKKTLRFKVDGQWISKKKVTVNIPARPFLGLSDDDMREIKATVEDIMGKED